MINEFTCVNILCAEVVNMTAFIDILIIAVIFVCVIKAYKKGFFRSMFAVIVKIISYIAAYVASGKLAPILYDSYFRDGVIRNIESRMDSSVPVGLSDQATTAVSSIPNLLAGAAKLFGFSAEKMEELLNVSELSNNLTSELESVIVGPIVTGICRVVIFSVVAFVVSLILSAVVDMIIGIRKLPVLSKADKLFGIALGVINGFLCAMLVSYFLVIVASIVDNSEIIEIIKSSTMVALFTKTSLFI